MQLGLQIVLTIKPEHAGEDRVAIEKFLCQGRVIVAVAHGGVKRRPFARRKMIDGFVGVKLNVKSVSRVYAEGIALFIAIERKGVVVVTNKVMIAPACTALKGDREPIDVSRETIALQGALDLAAPIIHAVREW